MGEVIALTPRDARPGRGLVPSSQNGLVEKHRSALGAVLDNDAATTRAIGAKLEELGVDAAALPDALKYSRLVPKEQLPALRAEIEARLHPAAPTEIPAVVATIIASFKVGDVLENGHAFQTAMQQELAGFPAAVLWESVRRARRTFQWLPSIAEMVEICCSIENELRAQLRVVDRMAKEYDRRAEAAERQLEQERREAEFWSRIAVNVGEVFVDGVRLAIRRWPLYLQDSVPVFWPAKAAVGESQAVRFARKVSAVARAEQARENGLAEFGHVVEVARMVVSDELAALRTVELIEGGRVDAISATPDATQVDLQTELHAIAAACGVILHATGAPIDQARPFTPEPLTAADHKRVQEDLERFRERRRLVADLPDDHPRLQRWLQPDPAAPDAQTVAEPGLRSAKDAIEGVFDKVSASRPADSPDPMTSPPVHRRYQHERNGRSRTDSRNPKETITSQGA